MASLEDLQGDQRRRLTDSYETFVRSMALLRGDSLSADQVSRVVGEAVAGASPEELRSSAPPTSAIGRIQQLLAQTVEAGRPRNMYGADAARAAQAAGGPDGQRGAGFSYIDAIRGGSSARFRELASDGGTRNSSSTNGGSQTGIGSPVTPEFARSFAGTGVVGGNLRIFSEVGLDRGTFNEFRKEGFSKEQIVDSAKDSKVLHFKGKEDLSAAQHAPVDLRKAAVAVEQAKTPEEKEKAQQVEAERAQHYEALPDSDKRKGHARHFIERLERRGHHIERHREIGARAQQDDAALSTPKDQAKPAERHAQDRTIAKGGKQKTASLAADADDAFGGPAPSTPTKPAAPKVAAVKPPAAGPTPS